MTFQPENENDTAAGGTLTRSEIAQQPDLWQSTYEIVARTQWTPVRVGSPVVIAGAGTSAYAASAIAFHWPNAVGIPTTDLLTASAEELEARVPGFLTSGRLISIARSGNSPESLGVIRRITRMAPEVEHWAITCNSAGKLARTDGVECIVLDPRTNDQSLVMTSSFSNLALAGLCLQYRERLKPVLAEICNGVKQRLPELDSHARQISAEAGTRVVVLASGALAPLAAESSLKILEMTAGRCETLAESFLGLRHGPLSFVTPDSIVLCFLSSSPERRKYEEDLIRELRRKGLGTIVGVAPADADTSLFHHWVPANAGQLPDFLRVPFEIVFAQLLGYHLSVKQGLDPDNPSPGGTITRVVQPFTIYDAADGL